MKVVLSMGLQHATNALWLGASILALPFHSFVQELGVDALILALLTSIHANFTENLPAR